MGFAPFSSFVAAATWERFHTWGGGNFVSSLEIPLHSCPPRQTSVAY